MTSTESRSPAAGEPSAAHTEAAATVPVADLTAADPTAAEQSAAEPSTAQPSTAQPVAAQPVAAQPVAAQPVAAQPAAATPTAAASPADQPDLGARLAALDAGLAAVQDRLADATARATARERVIDRQHAEIERLRSAERSGLLRPVVTDLYRLRNDLLRQAATTPDAITGEQARGLLRSFADEVRDALERCGITVLSVPPGAPFEPGRHHVTAVLPTTEPQHDGTIAELVGEGYLESDTGKVLAPARITLYRCAGDTTTGGPDD